MKKMKVLINGFGRIGRAIARINLEKEYFDIVAINDINPDIKNMEYLLKYDCTYGRLNNNITNDGENIIIDNSKIRIFHEQNIKNINLDDIDIVIESSGAMKNISSIEEMKNNGIAVKHFIITNVNCNNAKNIVFGINHESIEIEKDKIISSSICDVVALAPIYKIITENFHVKSGFLITLHPWLSYQNLLDGPSVSWSQPGDIYSHYALGRSAVQNIIPKSTSAVRALAKVFPNATDILESFSYRIPTNIVASAVLNLVIEENTDVEKLKKILLDSELSSKNNIIHNTNEPLISVDYLKNEYSTIIDTRWIKVKNQNNIEIVYWYDNEWGYSCKIVELIKYLTERYNN